MRKLLAAVLVLIGAGLGVAAYGSRSDAESATRRVAYFRAHPDELTATDRAAYFAGQERTAADARRLAVLCGAGAAVFCAGGVVLFVRRGRGPVTGAAAPAVEPAPDAETMRRWAGAALASPVEVHYARRYAILFKALMVFFGGMGLLIVATNGFTQTALAMVAMIGALMGVLYYALSTALKRAAHVFDASGVTRGDQRRFEWADFKGVDYLIALTKGGGRESLWRIELAFAGGKAWIIPQRVHNLAQINELVNSLPGPHRRRPA